MTATPMLMYSSRGNHYVSASNLIDAIFAHKKPKTIVVERNRFTYVPTNGSRKMVIRLRRFSD